MYFEALAEHYHFSLDEPVNKLSKEALDAVLYGTKGKKIKMHRRSEYGSGTYTTDFEGVIPNLERRYQETSSEWSRAEIEQVMSAKPVRIVAALGCGRSRFLSRWAVSILISSAINPSPTR